MFRRLDTGIETLNDLLIPEHRGKVSRDGIAFHNHVGFFGVIFGAAGSGKSVLSLHLCCRFAELGTRKKEHHAVYVTQEPFQLVKDKIVDHFGFLPQGTIYPEHEIPRIWNDKGNSTLTIVRMPLDPKRQKAKLEYILRMVKERFCVGRDPVAESQLLFCLDNAEAIALCAYPKEIREYAIPTDDDLPTNKQDHPERPKDELFFKRLRSYCAEHCLNAWFTFEEDRTQSMFTEELSIATTQEAYAADIVIRLGIRVFDNGYRERSLEIVKAKNQAHRRGRHHFTIQSKNSDSPGGIVIFPSIAAQLYVIGRRDLPESQTLVKSSTPAHKPCLLGIKEVDEEINLQRLGVSERAKLRILGNVVSVGYLNSDTVSVLVSDLDSIASEIAIQFALQNDQTTLYLSTLHSKSVIEDMLEKYLTLKKSKGRAKLHFRELQPEHISEGKLLKDIDRWIGNGKRSVGSSKCERVVIDNVFGLSKKFPLIHDERQFLAALFALLRYKAVPSLVVDMVDVGEGQNPLHESFAAGLADHVFILRHAELRSGVSKIFSVGKLAGIHKPDKLWELQETPERIVAEDRLAFFKGALSGKPEPVEVKLSVFGESENSPLHNYLKTECEELKATFGQNINVHACLADTYGAMQQSVEARNLSALGDCHVISIDEIWLGELIQRGLLQEFQIEFIDQDDPEKRLWNYQEYVTAAQDIAFYQERQRIRKKIRGERDPAKRAELRSRQGELRISDCNFAIPARVNVGVLTYNPNVYEMDSVKTVLHSARGSDVKDLIGVCSTIGSQGSLRHWVDNMPVKPAPSSWAYLVALQTLFIRALPPELKGLPISPSIYRTWEKDEDETFDEYNKRRETGEYISPVLGALKAGLFTCCMETRESCVSFFLELLLSLSQEGPFAVKDGKLFWEKRNTRWEDAVTLMLHLLSPWDLVRLSHGWYRPARIERPCLFSRQWFTGWGMLGQKQPGLLPLELPHRPGSKPTPVSGSWYLGILSGGSAHRAGAQIIKQLTSPDQELYKFNRGIGMPVRKSLYRVSSNDGLIEGRQGMLYAKGMNEIAVIIEAIAACSRDNSANEKEKEGTLDKLQFKLQQSCCPFFRQSIHHYRHISPLLMGMMVRAAKIAVNSQWLWTRKGFDTRLQEDVRSLVWRTKTRYQQLDADLDDRENCDQ